MAEARALLTEYAWQHALTDPSTGLVDAGWTGRMVGSLVRVTETAGYPRPHVFFWGHEPRTDGWTDPRHLSAYVYNTARGEGLHWRVPDAPFLVETFCMGDHGIVAGYRRDPDGRISAVLRSEHNADAETWGLALHRSTLLAVATEVDLDAAGDARPLIHDVMQAFWVTPTRAEAQAWGSYGYDSDPTGTAARPLARPFTARDIVSAVLARRLDRADRAWLRGSLALNSRPTRTIARRLLPRDDLLGAPPTAPDVPAS